MKANCTDSKNFELFESSKKLGRLTYKNSFSHVAEIKVVNTSPYQVKPTGLLGISYAVYKDNNEVATFKMNLNGQMVLSFKDEQDYIFKRKSMLNSKYIIENATGQELIRLMPSFDWSKLRCNYDIAFEDKPDILLVLIGMFCSNYYIAMSGGTIMATV